MSVRKSITSNAFSKNVFSSPSSDRLRRLCAIGEGSHDCEGGLSGEGIEPIGSSGILGNGLLSFGGSFGKWLGVEVGVGLNMIVVVETVVGVGSGLVINVVEVRKLEVGVAFVTVVETRCWVVSGLVVVGSVLVRYGVLVESSRDKVVRCVKYSIVGLIGGLGQNCGNIVKGNGRIGSNGRSGGSFGGDGGG